MIEYPMAIPEFMWHEANYKGYFAGYLKKSLPEMKPVRVDAKKRLIVCVKK